MEKSHNFDYDNIKTLYSREKYYTKRIIKEMTNIIKHNTVNKCSDVRGLSKIYRKLLGVPSLSEDTEEQQTEK